MSPLSLLTVGRTWIPSHIPSTVIQKALRWLDRQGLRTLSRAGAQSAGELLEGFRKGNRFFDRRLGTNISHELAHAWLEYAYRRHLVEPFPGKCDAAGAMRWWISDNGRDLLKTKPQLIFPLKSLPILGTVLGIVVPLVGGAVVVNQALKSNWDAVATVGTSIAGLLIYATSAAPVMWIVLDHQRRMTIGCIEVLRLTGLRDGSPMRVG